tara:strand:- start:6955 stop:7380 length:426 start_codon:yes stop_codon:yes gene_type:complete
MTIAFLTGILFHPITIIVFFTWLLGQILKVALDWKNRSESWIHNLTELGGMPSTHAVVVAALSTAVYLDQGATSLFIVTCIFSIIVVRDAIGVRQEVEEHAKILNKKFKAGLKANIGHTLREVVVGILFGVAVASMIWYLV